MAFGKNTTTSVTPTSSAGSSDRSASHPPAVILSPCAACKILRRRCVEKCVLAPYFPPTEPLKFTIAHRVFGASNIIKLLQELPEDQRADAVNSMVYEAHARLRDPIYGCTGAICHLQKQISDLQAELAKAQAEILNMQCQNANLCEQLSCKSQILASQNNIVEENYLMAQSSQLPYNYNDNSAFSFDDQANLGVSWDPLWT
ncbi:hypothetical protein DH2020_028536 [Rehmannia glutinosa]|uniref:LOB domain-containing protein n=1 Tax=Rehmannia glutinosa TaxID=99300 RepID=A0ABR0VS27_REHGL